MTNKIESYQQFLIVSAIILFILTFFIPEQYNLYDYLKSIRLQSYNAKHKEIFIKCLYCKGTGEREEDINELMYQAKMALWFNKHINIDRCKVCDLIEDKEEYPFGGKFICPLAQTTFMNMMKEYASIGPKIEKTGCSKCLGMGTFSSFDMKTGKYLTQEEYEAIEKDKSNVEYSTR